MAWSVPVHRPVMRAEVLAVLSPAPSALLLDGTVGTGGHAEAWLEASAPGGRVIGLDRDPSALEIARGLLGRFGDRLVLVHADYRAAGAELDRLGAPPPDAVLLDLGLGTHQVDDPERGFAFRHEAPLDMRFDRSRPAPTAAEILARAPEPELQRILTEYGEEPAARKLARAIVDARRRAPITTTFELAELVRRVAPARGRHRIDPATLVFQALRIAVNDELTGLGQALHELALRLRPGGRLAVIAYHSLEDRVAKHTLRRLSEPCRCRRGDPCTCGAIGALELVERRAARPSPEEIAENPRARSARLRWAVRPETTATGGGRNR
ncbi:MAG: 16S rRNA (cytosine(1402)-N(4))-methyltransferase RsmH [Acidobacteria bacterium]|nr:16S rRNA (cytosine(1402)-N(4))-methyltransferase RsmH [Acidobacteriota bacterium]